MFKRIIILTALVGLLAWSCSGDNPVGGGGDQTELQALAGGGRLAADDPIDGHRGADSGGVSHIDPDFPTSPDTMGNNWRVVFSSMIDCANQPGELVIADSASWRQWWDEAHACLWGDDPVWPDTINDYPGGPDTTGTTRWHDAHGRQALVAHADTLWPDSNMGDPGHPDTCWNEPGDTCWHDTIPPAWHGNPWTDSTRFDPPYVDFSRFIVAAIRVEYDSGAFCMRNVNIIGAGMQGSEFVISYEVTRLEGDCCGLIMSPIRQGEGAPVVAVIIEKPSTSNYRFERSEREYECWLPDPDDPLTLDYTFVPCGPVQNEQLITDQATWEQWYDNVHSCDTVYYRPPYPDTMLWLDTLNLGLIDSIGVPPTPPVDFSRYAVIILSTADDDRWGGGIWLNEYTNGNTGAVVEYTVMQPADNCPDVNAPPGHMTHTTAIRVLRPTNNQVTWRQSVRTIDCEWTTDTLNLGP